jgi:4-hydroxythreonine-4-phosphate dehydrogenase
MAGSHSETATSASSVRFSRCSGFVAQGMGVTIEGVNLLLIGGGLRIVHASLHNGIAFALTRLDKRNIERAARTMLSTQAG